MTSSNATQQSALVAEDQLLLLAADEPGSGDDLEDISTGELSTSTGVDDVTRMRMTITPDTEAETTTSAAAHDTTTSTLSPGQDLSLQIAVV